MFLELGEQSEALFLREIAELREKNPRLRHLVGFHLHPFHLEHDPIETEPEADRRRRFAAEFLNEIVIAAAATERVFLPFAIGRPDLEHGLRVIIETADQPRIDRIREFELVEIFEKRLEMRTGFIVEKIQGLRRRRRELDALVLLAVEDAERIRLETVAADLTKFLLLGLKESDERLFVPLSGFRDADRIHLEFDILETELSDDAIRELHDLRIENRIVFAEHVEISLPEFAVSPLLRAVVAEDGSGRKEPYRFRKHSHAVLDVRARDAGSELRSERDAIAATGLERIDLLVDDIGPLLDRADEKVEVLDGRGIDSLKPVLRSGVPKTPPDTFPVGLFVRQDVTHAAKRLEKEFRLRNRCLRKRLLIDGFRGFRSSLLRCDLRLLRRYLFLLRHKIQRYELENVPDFNTTAPGKSAMRARGPDRRSRSPSPDRTRGSHNCGCGCRRARSTRPDRA